MSFIKETKHDYPLIDADPHASRVVRYMRASDFAAWGALTAGFPGLMYLLEMADRSGVPQRAGLRVGTAFGFFGGFLYAYQRSSLRFWGWSENERERALDMAEMTERARRGVPLYGVSRNSEWIQGVAFRNSQWSQLFFYAIPWFNLVNHPHHGVDTSKYYEAARALDEAEKAKQQTNKN